MRVLVTGAAGFLGQHVCKALKGRGHQPIGLDAAWPDRSSVPGTWLEADITQSINLGAYHNPLDAVIHLAAIAAPRTCDDNPELAFNVNVNGTHQVLKLALEAGAKKFVFSSSAHVYGISPKYMPTDEHHPLSLGNTYTTTKILGEQLCDLYHTNHGLSYTTLRLFNAYGPGQVEGYFIPDMIAKAKLGSIELKGGSTTKDFVYVDDVARAFCDALETPFVGPINIGTGIQSCLSHVALKIANNANVGFSNIDMVGTSRMQCDNTRAKRVLGWEPTVNIEEGLDAILSQS